MINNKTILELNSMLKNNEISVNELYQSTLENIKETHAKLNCCVSIVDDYHIKDSYDFTKYLAGIPMVLKDNIMFKDHLVTGSSKSLYNFKSPYNATLVDNLIKEDAIIAARSSLDEFGMGGTNLTAYTGPVANPYDTTRMSGGSSGGSAVLVACGCIPYALGSDTGDSVRKPASYCGLYGYKPTWGRISRYGIIPYGSSLDQIGAFARCIDDLAISISTLTGEDPLDNSTYSFPFLNVFENMNPNNKKIKIAYIEEINNSYDDENVRTMFDENVQVIKDLGFNVDKINVDKDLLKAVRGVYHIIANAEATSNHANLTGVAFGNTIRTNLPYESILKTRTDNFHSQIKARFAIGSMALHHENKEAMYMKAKKVRRVLIETFNKIFDEYDIILAPTTGGVAPKFVSDTKSDYMSDNELIGENHLALVNLIGAPGLVIPTHMYQDLPMSISMFAKPFNDQILFDLSKQFENQVKDNEYPNVISFINKYVDIKEVK